MRGCRSGYGNNKEKISLFKVNTERLEEWSKVISRKNRSLRLSDRVCEKHFQKEDIIWENKTDTYSVSELKS